MADKKKSFNYLLLEIRLKKITQLLSIERGTLYQHLMRIRKELSVHNAIQILYKLHTHNSIPETDAIRLTPRGKEVSLLVLEGKTNSFIAQRLGMSKSAVRRHKEKMLLTNNCESMLELVAKYYRSHAEQSSQGAFHGN